ncbi:MAG: alpha/beta hydrolase [Vibrio gallaecicus]
MKFLSFITLITLTMLIAESCVSKQALEPVQYQLFYIESHRENLQLALHRYVPRRKDIKGTVLLLHGSSFPSKLSFGFSMKGGSWADHLVAHGYRVYMLDFLGFGDSDRYPEMVNSLRSAKPLGQLADISKDVANAVSFILNKEAITSIDLIGHSWGSAVAAHYTQHNKRKVKNLVLYASIYHHNEVLDKSLIPVSAYKDLSATARVESLNRLAPSVSLLASNMFHQWPQQWIASDPLADNSSSVRYPAGPSVDVQNLLRGRPLFNAHQIKSNVLVIRGEYDKFPSNEHASRLFEDLTAAKNKQYVVIGEGTHVIHLEKNRRRLYQHVISFLISTKQESK